MIAALLWVCGSMAGVLLLALFVGRFIRVGRGPGGDDGA